MLGRAASAYLGGKVAQHVRGLDTPVGAALGVLAPLVLRRLSWPAMLALGVGGYVAKRLGKAPAATTPTTTPARS